MYVEDLIIQVAESDRAYKMEADDYEFVSSVAHQVKSGKALTSRQAFAITKVLGKYAVDAEKLVGLTPRDFSACLASKMFRKELRVTVQKRTEARYLGDNLVGFTYQYQKELAEEASRLRAVWRNGVQVVGVTSKNVEGLISLFGQYRFEIDEQLEEYLALCLSSKNQDSHFISDGDAVVINVCDSETISNFLLHVVGARLI
jgi:hypothetical protein